MLRKLLSLTWWNERVVEVPEHFSDWLAPRWYPVLVCLVCAGVVALFVWSMSRP